MSHRVLFWAFTVAVVLAMYFAYLQTRTLDAVDSRPAETTPKLSNGGSPVAVYVVITPQPYPTGPQEMIVIIPTDTPRPVPTKDVVVATPPYPDCPQPDGAVCVWRLAPTPRPPTPTPTPYPDCTVPRDGEVCTWRDPTPTATPPVPTSAPLPENRIVGGN